MEKGNNALQNAYAVESPNTDPPYYGDLHSADKRLRSRIVPCGLLYIGTSLL